MGKRDRKRGLALTQYHFDGAAICGDVGVELGCINIFLHGATRGGVRPRRVEAVRCLHRDGEGELVPHDVHFITPVVLLFLLIIFLTLTCLL